MGYLCDFALKLEQSEQLANSLGFAIFTPFESQDVIQIGSKIVLGSLLHFLKNVTKT